MQIFELHFNPKPKEEQISDSFVYEPENIYEKKLGSLYMVGELKNILPQNLKFLDNLAQIVKKNYYTLSAQSPERALSETLKKTNEYLGEEVKKDNVSWLGNLNFSVLSIKDFRLTFTKTGNLKIILLRAGQIIDVGKNLDLREMEPYPLKVFVNIVSGRLLENDMVLILTEKIFKFLHQQNILSKLARTEGLAENINSKKIKEIVPAALFAKGEGKNVSGILFLSVLKSKYKIGKKFQPILFQKEEGFSFFQKITSKLPLLKLPKLKLPKLKLPKLKLPKFSPQPEIRKKIILIIVLIILLIFGYLIFKEAGGIKEGGNNKSLAEIEEKVNKADSFLIFKNEEQANTLLKEAWQEAAEAEAYDLKETIEKKLEEINKLEKIENPEEASETEYNKASTTLVPPENLFPLSDPDFHYDLSTSYLSNFYFLDKETCKIIKYPYLAMSIWGPPQIWKESDNNCLEPRSMAVDGSVWILNKDNSISRYYAGSFKEKINLDFFPLPENITKIVAKSNLAYLYLLEPVKNRVIITDKKGKIVKQFQSEKFDKLTDFAISEEGKTIYLKNNSKFFSFSFFLTR